MTPAIELAKKQKIWHEVHSYTHDRDADSYGLEAAEKLGIEAERVFKTLIVELDQNRLACAIVSVSSTLNIKRAAKGLSAKKAIMAEPSKAERSTGYVLGGVSPLAQKKRLPCIIDDSAKRFETIYVSAGRRGLEIELKPSDLANLTNAVFADIQDI